MKLFYQSVLLIVMLSFGLKINATSYYIDPDAGNNGNHGTSAEFPWASFNNLSYIVLLPGDQILLKAGTKINEPLSLKNIQGTANSYITIKTYGKGNRAIIDGNGAEAAIYMLNPAFLSIENLEVLNVEGKYGIYLEAKNAGALKDIQLIGLDVHDIYSASAEISSPPKTIGGIVFKVQKGEQPTWWDGILIENCKIHDLGSCGISIGSDYKVNKGIANREKNYPILNVRIRKNTISNIVRDGAIIRQCKGGIMEYNKVSRTGLVAISNGMWWYDSDSCFIQYNEGFECKAAFDKDGAPFSIDNSSTRCVIQYNYSHDNEGAGYMLFGHDDNGWGNIIRHNLSVNDHNSNISQGIGAIAVVSRVRDAHIHDNIVVAGPGTEYVLGHRNWDGFPIEVTYRNNLFIGNGLTKFGENLLEAGIFNKNLFLNIPDLPEKLQQQNTLENFFEKFAQLEVIKAGVKAKK